MLKLCSKFRGRKKTRLICLILLALKMILKIHIELPQWNNSDVLTTSIAKYMTSSSSLLVFLRKMKQYLICHFICSHAMISE